MPEPAAPLVRRPFAPHLSFSQVGGILECGEKFRLERGYGLSGPSSWALVGGKAFHAATQFVDIALEAARYGTTSAWPAEDVLRSVPEASDSTGNGSPVTEKSQYISDLEAGNVGLNKSLRELASDIAAASDQPGSVQAGEGGSPIREMWRTALDIGINDERLGALRGQQAGQFVVPEPTTWRAAGRPSKQWPDKENGAFWRETGEAWLASYVTWRRTSGWQIAYLGSTPAIEVDLSATIGDVPVVGFLDRGMLNPHMGGAPTTVDIKTSKTVPVDAEQCGLYAVLLEVLGYPRANYGAFWMARTGQMTDPYDLSRYSLDYFTWKLRAAKAVRDSGALLPNTHSPFCRSCGVRDHCFAVGGSSAHLVPLPWLESASPVS